MTANDWVIKEPVRYYLDRDEDGHWFVLPVANQEEWERWLDGVYNAYNHDPLPEWVTEVNGSPTRVTFTDWKIE